MAEPFSETVRASVSVSATATLSGGFNNVHDPERALVEATRAAHRELCVQAFAALHEACPAQRRSKEFHALLGYLLGNRDGIDAGGKGLPAYVCTGRGRRMPAIAPGSGAVEKKLGGDQPAVQPAGSELASGPGRAVAATQTPAGRAAALVAPEEVQTPIPPQTQPA